MGEGGGNGVKQVQAQNASSIIIIIILMVLDVEPANRLAVLRVFSTSTLC